MLTIDGPPSAPRYVFIGGLHRSGTSLLAGMVTALPGTVGIAGARVPGNEGAYLQGAIPHDARHGRPMHFATDPAQHLTESHALNRLETRVRLAVDWEPWFADTDPGLPVTGDETRRPWRVEKSPTNMVRTRLLQALFPMSHFLVILRHPAVVAAAVAKWMDADPSLLIDHWLDAHDRLREDLAYLHAAVVLRYEDLTADPLATSRGVAAFLDLRGPNVADPAIRNRNGDYPDAPCLSEDQARRAAEWGYGPRPGEERPWQTVVSHPLRDVRDAAGGWFAATDGRPAPADTPAD